ncbi:MAG TPA: hypothetical protein VFQ89_03505, partial [Candidatus Binatia bacterium]|nr:hypothetical protein [Candidatus Binatia bacterium]
FILNFAPFAFFAANIPNPTCPRRDLRAFVASPSGCAAKRSVSIKLVSRCPLWKTRQPSRITALTQER